MVINSLPPAGVALQPACDQTPKQTSRDGRVPQYFRTMGRTSKFAFQIPGRWHSEKKAKPVIEEERPSPPGLSKAQRILGTSSDLYIDSTTPDNASFRSGRPRSRGMSVAMSERTNNSREAGKAQGWEVDPDVLVRPPNLSKKASSTLLGPFHDAQGDEVSSLGRRLHGKDSSSTLRSHYDRQKSPLAISQQTSASSARDLALRKGFQSVAQISRSSLMEVEHSDAVGGEDMFEPVHDKTRKKLARLDLSSLFPKPGKGSGKLGTPEPILTSPASATGPLTATSEPSRRRPLDSASKESLRQNTKGTERPHFRQTQSAHDTLYHLYDHYESLPDEPLPDIPDFSAYSRTQIPAQAKTERRTREEKPKQTDDFSPTSRRSSASWNHPEPLHMPPAPWTKSPWDANSVTSVSSKNTKTSRRTSNSVFSSSDLQQNSVLSLSSDDSGDDSGSSPSDIHKSSVSSAPSEARVNVETQHQSSNPTQTAWKKTPVKRTISKRQNKDFLTIPLASPPLARRVSTKAPASAPPTQPLPKPPQLPNTNGHHDERPVSPTSMEFVQSSYRSSRFMAVTKQEEALLDALRQKRARMRESIIKEHEKDSQSPVRHSAFPRDTEPLNVAPNSRRASRISQASTTSSLNRRVSNRKRASSSGKESILLCLDQTTDNIIPEEPSEPAILENSLPSRTSFPRPPSHARPRTSPAEIDASEPSPDLSDFLTFGSADSTPRTSWAREPPATFPTAPIGKPYKRKPSPHNIITEQGRVRNPVSKGQGAPPMSAVARRGSLDDKRADVLRESMQTLKIREDAEPKQAEMRPPSLGLRFSHEGQGGDHMGTFMDGDEFDDVFSGW